MPISQSEKVTTNSLISSTPPTLGQVPSADGSGGFVWVENAGSGSEAKLVSFITDIKRRGFVDNTETSIPYLSGTQNDVVNLDDMGTGWSYYFNGAKRTISGNKTVALTGGEGNAHADGKHYFYIDTNDGTLKTKIAPFSLTEGVLVASVAWDSALPSGARAVIADERHSDKWDSSVHEYIHNSMGTQLWSGGVVSGYTELSDVDADKQYSISQALIADEDLEHTLDALVGGNGKYALHFRTSAGVWGWSYNNNMPFRYTVSGRMNYDDGTAEGAEIPSGKYMNTYVLLTNIEGQLRHSVLTSQTYYDDLPTAYSASFGDLDLTGMSIPEFYVAYKISWKSDDALTSTGKSVIEKVINYGANAHDKSATQIGAPSLVGGAVVGNLVSFVTTTGEQQDSGVKASDFQLASGKDAANGYAGLDASKNISLQTGGIKDANVTTAIKLGDAQNTSLASTNKTIVGSINEIESELSYLSTGSFGVEGTFTDNNNGSATVSDVEVLLYNSADFTGTLKKYSVVGDDFVFTDGEEEYVVVDYNSGTPVMRKETDLSLINSSNIIRLFIVWRVGNVCHSLGFDSLGRGLSNKLQDSESLTELYQLEINGGLQIAEVTSPNPRTITVTGANVYTGAIKQIVGSFDSSTDAMTEVVHISSAWTYTDKLVYNNSQFDAGVNPASLGSGKYGVVWFYRSIGDNKQLFYVLGTQAYDSETLALLSQPRSDLPIVLKRHCMLIGRAIILSGATSGNVQSSFNLTFNGYSPMSHNDTTSKQGGTTGEYYHLTSAQNTAVGNLGTISTQASDNVSITGGAISGTTITGTASLDLPLSGGTMTGKIVTKTSDGATGTGLNIPVGVVPNTPVSGDVWNSSVFNSMSYYIAGIRENLTGTLFTKTAPTTVPTAATNVETSLVGTGVGGGLTLPANFLTSGKNLKIKAIGYYTSSAASATFDLKLYLGNVVLLTAPGINPANGLTSLQWSLDADCTIASTGNIASGTVWSQGLFRYASNSTSFAFFPLVTSAAVAIDTTVQNLFDFRILYTQTTANNSFTCTNLIVSVEN